MHDILKQSDIHLPKNYIDNVTALPKFFLSNDLILLLVSSIWIRQIEIFYSYKFQIWIKAKIVICLLHIARLES